MRFKYCPSCGHPVVTKAFEDTFREYCEQCQTIHYKNPIVGVAIIIMDGSHILLAKRNNSYSGKWCIPCGYVEWDEDVREAAIREFEEETGLKVKIDHVYNVHSNFHDRDRQTVGIWFKGHIIGGEINAGSDVDEAEWFDLSNLPDMAFPTDLLIIEELNIKP